MLIPLLIFGGLALSLAGKLLLALSRRLSPEVHETPDLYPKL